MVRERTVRITIAEAFSGGFADIDTEDSVEEFNAFVGGSVRGAKDNALETEGDDGTGVKGVLEEDGSDDGASIEGAEECTLEEDGSNDGTSVEGAEEGTLEEDGSDDGSSVEGAEEGTLEDDGSDEGSSVEGAEEGTLEDDGSDEGTSVEGGTDGMLEDGGDNGSKDGVIEGEVDESGPDDGALLGGSATIALLVILIWLHNNYYTRACVAPHWIQILLARNKQSQASGLASVCGASSARNECIWVCHGKSVTRIGSVQHTCGITGKTISIKGERFNICEGTNGWRNISGENVYTKK